MDNLTGFVDPERECNRVAEQQILAICEFSLPERKMWGEGEVLEEANGIQYTTDGSRLRTFEAICP